MICPQRVARTFTRRTFSSAAFAGGTEALSSTRQGAIGTSTPNGDGVATAVLDT